MLRYVLYTAHQPKNTERLFFCSYCPALLGRNVHLVIFSSMRPFVASGEKPKAFFSLTEFMPFKFEYNSNFDHILVKHLNVVFQPI